jgi:HEAT repeat protein
MGKLLVNLACGLVIAMVLLAGWVLCSPEPVFRLPGLPEGEAVYRGQPASTWLDQLQARDPAFRQQAVQALQMIGPHDERVVPALAGMLQDPSADVRKSTAFALRCLGSEASGAVPSLVRALQDENRAVRLYAAHALRSMQPRDETVIVALLPMLQDESPLVRQTMLQFLGDLGPAGKIALPAVRAALADPDVEVRWEAAEALARIAGPPKEESLPR